MAKRSGIGASISTLLVIIVGIIFIAVIWKNKNFLRFGSPITATAATGDAVPGPIDMNEDFTVCVQASNGVVSGCQSGINGPESEPERITIDVS